MDYSKNYEKVELFLACRNLKNLDALSKSDAQCRLYVKNQGQWEFIGKTETRTNNLNPNFRATFTLDYIFEVQQALKFEVVDVDDQVNYEVIGVVETTIGAIVGCRGGSLTLDLTAKGLKGSKSTGKIIIRGETVAEGSRKVTWQWSAVKLLNLDGYGDKSDPFLRFIKVKEGGDSFQVYDTEVIKDNLNPVWRPFEIPDLKLCADHNQIFRVECWDWEKSGEHEYIGGCEVTFADILEGKTLFELANYKRKQKLGQLKLEDFSIEEPQAMKPKPKPQVQTQPQPQPQRIYPKPQPQKVDPEPQVQPQVVPQRQEVQPQPQVQQPQYSFMDYLRSGTTLNTVVAVDFSASNGALTSPDSLHFINQDGAMNEYQKAIYCVCQILLNPFPCINYDYDQQTAMLGFGAIPNYPELKSKTSADCFPMSGSFEQQQAQGLQGVMDIYYHALKNVELAGPTNFGTVIKETMNICEANKNANTSVYTILLLVTNGKVEDMEETKNLIIKAAALPLSIIIVGVGNGDFTKMEILDGDKGLTNSKGEKAKRDLVQFVPFREFNDMNSLAQRVLQEVPGQLVEYMSLIGKRPF